MPNLELNLTQTAAEAISAALRLSLPNRRSDLAEAVPLELDYIALLALSAMPEAYAAALTAMVFPQELRAAWERALGFAEGQRALLRVRLHLQGDQALHALHWELLRDPVRNTPLAYNERVCFSRYLASASLAELHRPTQPEVRAVVAVSSAAGPGMAAVDPDREREHALQGFGALSTTLLDGRAGRPPATLAQIMAALRDGPAILYLVCHGVLVDGEPYLYLEREAGEPARPVSGTELVNRIALLPRRPALVVLAACAGAGHSTAVLNAVGPQLARSGIGAVLAMFGHVPQALVAALMPRFFAELLRDGRIDRALAAARAALPADLPWWLPTLWMSVTDGALWQTSEAPIRGSGVVQTPYPINPLFRGRDAELAQLAAILIDSTGGTATVQPAIAGMGGIGKTQLAAEFTHRYGSAFPGGVFWLHMARPETIAAQVAAAGGPGGLDLPGWNALAFADRVAAVQRAWNEPTRRLIVFDNLEDPRLLHEWRPRGGGARVLITTRRGVWSAAIGVQPVPLSSLNRAESIRLLLAPRYGAAVEEALADPAVAAAATTICAQVGDLPLALALAGAYLEQTPRLSLEGYSARLAEQLLAHPSLEAELEEGLPTRHAESIAATIALSYRQLNATAPKDALALHLLQRVAQLAPAPIPAPLLVALADRDPTDEDQAAAVDPPLRRLAALGLIDLLPDGGATLHRLIAAFVRDQDSAAPARTAGVVGTLIRATKQVVTTGHPQNSRPYLTHVLYCIEQPAQLRPILPHQHQELTRLLGALFKEQGDFPAARRYLQAVVQQRRARLGPAATATATAMNELAMVLKAMGAYPKALSLYKRVLEVYERNLGAEHLWTTTALNNLATLLHEQGDLAAARQIFERALTLREQMLGPEHPDTAVLIINLGDLLADLGDLKGARAYLERAQAIHERSFPPDHPRITASLSSIGRLAYVEGDLDAAQRFFEQTLAISRRIYGVHHPDTAAALHNVSLTRAAAGDYTAAQQLLQEALGIREALLGPEHPDTANSLNALASLLQDQGDFSGAYQVYLRTLAIYEQVYGTVHLRVAETLNNLASLFYDWRQSLRSVEYAERALAVWAATVGPEHHRAVTTLLILRDALAALGELARALAISAQVVEVRTTQLGPQHPDTLRSLYQLGTLQLFAGDAGAADTLRRLIAAQADYPLAHYWLALYALSAGDDAAALASLDAERAREGSVDHLGEAYDQFWRGVIAAGQGQEAPTARHWHAAEAAAALVEADDQRERARCLFALVGPDPAPTALERFSADLATRSLSSMQTLSIYLTFLVRRLNTPLLSAAHAAVQAALAERYAAA